MYIANRVRGFKFGWGLKPTTRALHAVEIIGRMFIVRLVNLISIAILVLSRDFGSPAAALAYLGVPNFMARTPLSEALATLSFGVYLITILELAYYKISLSCYAVHWLAQYIKLPPLLLELTDPIWFPPIFNSLHTSTSLAWLWGKGWHQIFRRSFVWCGAYPASTVARRLGFGHTVQKIFGLIGTFFVSGLMHEYGRSFIRCIKIESGGI